MFPAVRALDRQGDDGKKAGEAKRAPKAEPSVPKSKRLVCVACGNAVTTTPSRTEVSGQHAHVFCNPSGAVFEIGCFRDAPGAAAAGPPEHFWSWFPGYAWRVAICRGCLAHLGWAYGEDEFWGLILDRLAEDETEDDATP